MQIQLTDFTTEFTDLTEAVYEKIEAKLISKVNSNIKKELEIKREVIDDLLSTIESRLAQCEEIHYMFLAEIDQRAINSISANSVKELNFEILSASGRKNVSIMLDLSFYKNVVDTNFQYYILTTAALYENFVFLIEMLLRKTIIYVDPPRSTPLELLINYKELLLSLGYKQVDDFTVCVDNHAEYFKLFLPAIRFLRNSFIHGFSTNLISDGFTYKIKNDNVAKVLNKPAMLEVDAFSYEILRNTIKFSQELLPCLTKMVKGSTTAIPI